MTVIAPTVGSAAGLAPLRVLHVITWLNRGGIESWLLDVVGRAPRTALAIDICCKGAHSGQLADRARDAGAAVIHLPMGRLGPLNPLFTARLTSVLRDGRYDAVHSHLGDFSEPVLDAARRAGIPTRVVMYHQVEHRFEHHPIIGGVLRAWQVRVRLRIRAKATAVVGCSQSVLSRLFPRTSGPGFGVLHPTVDTARFHADPQARGSVREEFGLAPDAPIVVNVGNVGYAKNQRTIVEVAARLHALGTPATFVIVGEGPLRARLEAEVTARGLADRVRFVGSRPDVARLLSAADVAMHPSVAEGLPVSVLEYQSAGLPVLGSNIAPVLEALAPANRLNSRAPDDADGFATALLALLGNRELCTTTGASARAWVTEWFSSKRVVETLLALYRRPTHPAS